MTDQFGIQEALDDLGVKEHNQGTSTGSEGLEAGQGKLVSVSPADGATIGTVAVTTAQEYEQIVTKAQAAFLEFFLVLWLLSHCTNFFIQTAFAASGLVFVNKAFSDSGIDSRNSCFKSSLRLLFIAGIDCGDDFFNESA